MSTTSKSFLYSSVRNSAFVVAIASSIAVRAQAQAQVQSPIEPDQPGFGFATSTVPEHRLQFELGLPNLVLDRSNGDDLTAWNFPMLVRYGLTQNAELRLSSPTWISVHDDNADETTTGFGDVEIGTKITLCDARDWIPKTAVVAGVIAPVGSDDFTFHQPGYELDFAMDWNVGGGNILNALLGVLRVPDGEDNSVTLNSALQLGRAFDDRWSGSVQIGWFPRISHAETSTLAGFGVTYIATNDLAFDATGSFGLDDSAPDAVLGLGISWRL